MFGEPIILFVIYSIIGWAFESAYCSMRTKKLINRGFLFGPLCPIYGFGSMLIIYALSPVMQYPLLVFLLAFLLTSALEYAVSLLLEVVFKKSWWDYSEHRLNLNGRVWLVASAIWGLLAMFLVYLLHPSVMAVIRPLSLTVKNWIAVVLLLAIAVDLAFSVRDTVIFNREMKRLAELSARIDRLKAELLKYGSLKRDELLAFGTETKDRLELELNSLLSQREVVTSAFLSRMRRIFDAFPRIKLNRKDKISLRERLSNFRREK